MRCVFHSRYTPRARLAMASLSPSPSATLRSRRSRSGVDELGGELGAHRRQRPSRPRSTAASAGDRGRPGLGGGDQLGGDRVDVAVGLLRWPRDEHVEVADRLLAPQDVEDLVLLVGEDPLELAGAGDDQRHERRRRAAGTGSRRRRRSSVVRRRPRRASQRPRRRRRRAGRHGGGRTGRRCRWPSRRRRRSRRLADLGGLGLVGDRRRDCTTSSVRRSVAGSVSTGSLVVRLGVRTGVAGPSSTVSSIDEASPRRPRGR